MLKAVTFAMAVFFMSRNKKCKKRIRTCVFVTRFVFFDYGLYMFCVACMILAYAFAVQIAIALLLISRGKKMQKSKRTCVLTRCDLSNMDCICVV